jgi:hypothetical protein
MVQIFDDGVTGVIKFKGVTGVRGGLLMDEGNWPLTKA